MFLLNASTTMSLTYYDVEDLQTLTLTSVIYICICVSHELAEFTHVVFQRSLLSGYSVIKRANYIIQGTEYIQQKHRPLLPHVTVQETSKFLVTLFSYDIFIYPFAESSDDIVLLGDVVVDLRNFLVTTLSRHLFPQEKNCRVNTGTDDCPGIFFFFFKKGTKIFYAVTITLA